MSTETRDALRCCGGVGPSDADHCGWDQPHAPHPMSTETRDALENDLRELAGADPGELARRLIERGWTLRATDAPVAEGLREAVIAAEWMDPTPEAGSGRCPACHAYRANGTGHSPYCWFTPIAALATPEPDA